MFTFETFACNEQSIHTALAGPDDAPVVLMLHGFPEYWAAWADVAAQMADDFRLVLPDQRGFNRSSNPPRVEDYDAKHLVADMVALLGHVSPDRPVILCGHDWGASVAYALAMRQPDRVSHLVIANGVHPVCFQNALYGDPAQREASQYMRLLRQPDVADHMAADGFARTFRMFEKFSSAPWLNAEKRMAYRDAWGHDHAMRTMLHWYSSSPIVVPDMEADYKRLPITQEMRAKYAISVPHLLIWGMDDTALLPSARADLAEFAPDLSVVELEDASHWLLHERSADTAKIIRAFLEQRPL